MRATKIWTLNVVYQKTERGTVLAHAEHGRSKFKKFESPSLAEAIGRIVLHVMTTQSARVTIGDVRREPDVAGGRLRVDRFNLLLRDSIPHQTSAGRGCDTRGTKP